MFISNHLLEGEKVVFQTRVHWMTFIPWFVLSAFGFLSLLFVPQSKILIGGIQIASAIFLIKALASYVFFLTSIYGITTHRVLGKTGVIKIHSLDVLLLKVESVKLKKGLFGRIFGYGDLIVSGTGGTQHDFNSLPKPMKIRKLIQHLANRAHAKTDGITVSFTDDTLKKFI